MWLCTIPHRGSFARARTILVDTSMRVSLIVAISNWWLPRAHRVCRSLYQRPGSSMFESSTVQGTSHQGWPGANLLPRFDQYLGGDRFSQHLLVTSSLGYFSLPCLYIFPINNLIDMYNITLEGLKADQRLWVFDTGDDGPAPLSLARENSVVKFPPTTCKYLRHVVKKAYKSNAIRAYILNCCRPVRMGQRLNDFCWDTISSPPSSLHIHASIGFSCDQTCEDVIAASQQFFFYSSFLFVCAAVPHREKNFIRDRGNGRENTHWDWDPGT